MPQENATQGYIKFFNLCESNPSRQTVNFLYVKVHRTKSYSQIHILVMRWHWLFGFEIAKLHHLYAEASCIVS